MSTTCHLLFNAPRTLREVVELVQDAVGVSLRPPDAPDEAWRGSLFGQALYVFDCDFEDDMGIAFSDYAYAVGITTGAMGPVQGVQLETIALIAYALYCHAGITGIVVWNLQRLIARYEERECDGETTLFDTVSDTFVHPIAQHVLALDAMWE